jgi:hypothetical protein
MTQFNKDWRSGAVMGRLLAQKDLVTSIGTQSTPTFLLREDGGKLVYWFIGLNGQAASVATPAYPGLKDLERIRPWDGGKLPLPPDVAEQPDVKNPKPV